jgi:hypothetical protein
MTQSTETFYVNLTYCKQIRKLLMDSTYTRCMVPLAAGRHGKLQYIQALGKQTKNDVGKPTEAPTERKN